MRQFRVRWEIDLEAETIDEAAKEALRIQRDHASIATAFDVKDVIAHAKWKRVDFFESTIDEVEKA